MLAHFNLLKGRLAAKRGQVENARFHFEKALEIRTEVEPYPKGAAEAMVGIAWTYFAEGKYGAAMHYGFQAIKTYSYFLLRGFF